MHAGDAIPNIVTVWLALGLLLLNLDQARDVPLIAVGPFLGFGVLLPTVGLTLAYARRKWSRVLAEQLAREALAEGEADGR